MRNGRVLDIGGAANGAEDMKDLPVLRVHAFAFNTQAVQGRVQGSIQTGLAGTFISYDMMDVKLYMPYTLECERKGMVYRIRGAVVTGMRLGRDEKGDQLIEAQWGNGAYECEAVTPASAPAAGGLSMAENSGRPQL